MFQISSAMALKYVKNFFRANFTSWSKIWISEIDQKISKVFRYSSAFMLNYVQRSFRKITVSEIVQMISEVFRCFRYVQQCCWYMFRSVSAEKNTVSNFSKLFQTGLSNFQQILRKKIYMRASTMEWSHVPGRDWIWKWYVYFVT